MGFAEISLCLHLSAEWRVGNTLSICKYLVAVSWSTNLTFCNSFARENIYEWSKPAIDDDILKLFYLNLHSFP